ncbi:MAG: hypothetical protein ACW991_01225 [Candidatus Hodarchaeales archaeon]|jgi:hypothetical protein
MNATEQITEQNDSSLKHFETEILTYLNLEFPDYYHKSILEPKKPSLKYMASLFDDFEKTYQDREKYNLHWAFKQANEAFKFEDLKKSSSTQECFRMYDEVAQTVQKQAIKRVNRFSRSFSFLSHGVSLLDIIISVFLILVVTQISHIGDHLFETVLLSTLFIAFIALIKVSLDRFIIIPVIDSWGWTFYSRMISFTRQELIKLNATWLVLMESTAREESLEKRVEIMNRQKRDIVSQRRWFSWVPVRGGS